MSISEVSCCWPQLMNTRARSCPLTIAMITHLGRGSLERSPLPKLGHAFPKHNRAAICRHGRDHEALWREKQRRAASMSMRPAPRVWLKRDQRSIRSLRFGGSVQNGLDDAREGVARAVQPALHRAQVGVGDLGDLLVGLPLHLAQDEHRAMVLG